MITKIEKANVELDTYTILMKINTKDDLEEVIGIIRDEFNKNLGDVNLTMEVRNLICLIGGK